MRRRLTKREQPLDGWIVGAPGGTQLGPGAVAGILVRPEADQLRPVPEAVALHLVVPDLGDELRPERRLLEVARAPPVGLGEAAVRGLVEEREDERADLVVVARGDRGGADVVGPAVVSVE